MGSIPVAGAKAVISTAFSFRRAVIALIEAMTALFLISISFNVSIPFRKRMTFIGFHVLAKHLKNLTTIQDPPISVLNGCDSVFSNQIFYIMLVNWASLILLIP